MEDFVAQEHQARLILLDARGQASARELRGWADYDLEQQGRRRNVHVLL